jgi:hypothetical protein
MGRLRPCPNYILYFAVTRLLYLALARNSPPDLLRTGEPGHDPSSSRSRDTIQGRVLAKERLRKVREDVDPLEALCGGREGRVR